MGSTIIRFVLIAACLIAIGVIGCKKPAQDVCSEEDATSTPPVACEIDNGCGEPTPGTCQMLGSENPTPTCVAD
jgi:hypothetical protein